MVSGSIQLIHKPIERLNVITDRRFTSFYHNCGLIELLKMRMKAFDCNPVRGLWLLVIFERLRASGVRRVIFVKESFDTFTEVKNPCKSSKKRVPASPIGL